VKKEGKGGGGASNNNPTDAGASSKKDPHPLHRREGMRNLKKKEGKKK